MLGTGESPVLGTGKGPALGAGEGLQSGLSPAEDQRVDVMRAFVGVHRFQIHHVADHVELV